MTPAAPTLGSPRLEALAKLVHELRTPICGVLGLAQLMAADGPLSARQNRRLTLITESGQHLLRLVDDILEFARLDARQLRLHPQPVSLSELLGDTVAMVGALAEARGLAVGLSLPANLPARLLVDARRLRQVLLNLLSNAVKFTEQGSVQLRVKLAEADERSLASHGGPPAAWQLRFEVIDTGRGIGADQLAQLYHLFRRPSDGPEAPDGNGVGLLVARELVALMGGELMLSSSRGQGTSVSFTLALPGATVPREAP